MRFPTGLQGFPRPSREAYARRLGIGNYLQVPFQLPVLRNSVPTGTAPGHPTGNDGSTNFPEVLPGTPRKPGAVFKAYWMSYLNSGRVRRRKLPISGEQPLSCRDRGRS